MHPLHTSEAPELYFLGQPVLFLRVFFLATINTLTLDFSGKLNGLTIYILGLDRIEERDMVMFRYQENNLQTMFKQQTKGCSHDQENLHT